MRIRFDDARRLIAALNWVTPLASGDGVVLMRAYEASVTFRAEGNPGMRTASIDAHVADAGSERGSVPMSGPHVIQMVRALQDKHAKGEITMDVPADDNIAVAYSHLTFPIARLSSPFSLQGDKESFSLVGEADCGDFMSMLKSAQSLTGSQTGAISMVDLEFDSENMRVSAMGSDKYVIGVFTAGFEPSHEYVDDVKERGGFSSFLLIPDMNGIPAETGDMVTVSESPDSMKIDFGDGKTITFRKQGVKRLNWRKMPWLKPEGRTGEGTPISMNVKDLLTSVSIVSMASGFSADGGSSPGARTRIVTLEAENGLVSIRSEIAGAPTDSIPTKYQGRKLSLQFNADELKKAVQALSEEDISLLSYGPAPAPAIIESDTMVIIVGQARKARRE